MFLFVEFPTPALGDLSDLRQLQKQRQRQCHPGHLGMRYGDLCRLDTVTVHLVPEKKGLFLKHVEYQVTSKVRYPCSCILFLFLVSLNVYP